MSKRIIIVEDERIIAEDIRRSLLNFKYNVPGIISSGEETLERLEELNPDLILMDIMLEGDLTGIDTASKIKTKYNIPIIYLTAYTNENILQSAKLTQPFGYIIKPFEEKELYAAIEMTLYRHDMENILKESEKKYHILFNSIADPIFIFSKDDPHIMDCNDAVLKIYGYTKEELTNLTPFDLHLPKEAEKFKTDIELEEAKKPHIYTHLKKNGEKLIVEILIDEIYYEGKPAWLCVAHDITERIKAEEKLRKTQSRLSTVFKNVPNIILYEVGEGRRFISENILDLVGYPAEEFISNKNKFKNLIHKDDRKIIRKKVHAWKEEGAKEMITLWYRVKTASGKYIWIEDRMVSIKPENGNKYLTGVLIDISDLKRVEEALKKSQSRYKAVVEDQTEFINRFLKDGTLTFVNQAYCRYTNKTYEDSVGTSWIKELSKENQKHFKKLFHSLTIENPVIVREYMKESPDGELKWTEWSYRALYNDEGDFIEYQSVGKDITERKKAEAEKQKIQDQLYQAQKMESVGRLAGGIAHDFNNLLTAINGYADLAKSKLTENDAALKDIIVIKDCGEKAAKLTQQLLGFSRKQIIEQKIIDLNIIIVNLEKMLKRLIGDEIELTSITEEKECVVKADPGQIEQVLVNLVINARDAMPEEGKITLKTSNEYISKKMAVKLNFENSGNYSLISVIDTGIGMDEEIQKKIFEPFFTTKEMGKGTGLGLATVFGIVKQNNGYILVESEIGKGSTFKIYLPQVDEEVSVQKPKVEEVEELPTGSETILLVEDEESIREFIVSILEEYGYNVLQASNGEEGLTISKEYKEPIHLLLSDIKMPKMGGPGLAKELATIHQETKVLFISGHTDDDNIRKEISESKAKFLQKPFSFPSLINMIREILDN